MISWRRIGLRTVLRSIVWRQSDMSPCFTQAQNDSRNSKNKKKDAGAMLLFCNDEAHQFLNPYNELLLNRL